MHQTRYCDLAPEKSWSLHAVLLKDSSAAWLQERADDLEEQVAAAEAELQRLEASQRDLEARNAVLETFANLGLTPARHVPQQDVLVRHTNAGALACMH